MRASHTSSCARTWSLVWKPHAAPLEQRQAGANACLAPLARVQIAVHEVAANVGISKKRVKLVQRRQRGRLIVESYELHCLTILMRN
jgi:hypothetical protein